MVSRGLLQVGVTLYAGRVPSAVLREAGAQLGHLRVRWKLSSMNGERMLDVGGRRC